MNEETLCQLVIHIAANGGIVGWKDLLQAFEGCAGVEELRNCNLLAWDWLDRGRTSVTVSSLLEDLVSQSNQRSSSALLEGCSLALLLSENSDVLKKTIEVPEIVSAKRLSRRNRKDNLGIFNRCLSNLTQFSEDMHVDEEDEAQARKILQDHLDDIPQPTRSLKTYVLRLSGEPAERDQLLSRIREQLPALWQLDEAAHVWVDRDIVDLPHRFCLQSAVLRIDSVRDLLSAPGFYMDDSVEQTLVSEGIC